MDTVGGGNRNRNRDRDDDDGRNNGRVGHTVVEVGHQVYARLR